MVFTSFNLGGRRNGVLLYKYVRKSKKKDLKDTVAQLEEISDTGSYIIMQNLAIVHYPCP